MNSVSYLLFTLTTTYPFYTDETTALERERLEISNLVFLKTFSASRNDIRLRREEKTLKTREYDTER